MKRAIVTGASGQDGQYLCRFLLDNGYEVLGLSRDARRALDAHKLSPSFAVEEWQPGDAPSLSVILQRFQPMEFYNLAAISSGADMYNDPVGIAQVNGIVPAVILDCIHRSGLKIRFLQASSREVFGDARVSPQNELTRRCPRSPYGAAKQYADDMVRIYRERYGVFAASAILFNHDSPLRSCDFVTRKVSIQVARIKLGLESTLMLGDLAATRDWGFAGDYVKAMWKILQHSAADDFVVASGVSHSVQELCEVAFSHLDLDFRDHVRVDTSSLRPREQVALVGDISKARDILSWWPELGFTDLIKMMVDADLARERERLAGGNK